VCLNHNKGCWLQVSHPRLLRSGVQGTS